jgi:hypothetical protein
MENKIKNLPMTLNIQMIGIPKNKTEGTKNYIECKDKIFQIEQINKWLNKQWAKSLFLIHDII